MAGVVVVETFKSGRLLAACRLGAGGATAFRATGFCSVLAGSFGGSGGSCLEMFGETSLAGSGDEAGETGEMNVSTTGVLISSFWYSGVGGRFADGRCVASVFELLELPWDR